MEATPVVRLVYRPADAAKMLDVHRGTVYSLIEQGLLRSFKVGGARFISHEELQRFIREQEEAGK